jgi:ferrous iron transport protein B
MADRMEHKGIHIFYLEEHLKTKIALVSSRKGFGIAEKKMIVTYKTISSEPCLNASGIDPEYFDSLRKAFPNQLLYKLWLSLPKTSTFELRTKRNQ